MSIMFKASGHIELELGYCQFNVFRVHLAESLPLPDNLKLNYRQFMLESSHKLDKENWKVANDYVPNEVIEFLFMPDCEGKLDYKKCRTLYKYLNDYSLDDTVEDSYLGKLNILEEIKELWYHCWKRHVLLRW